MADQLRRGVARFKTLRNLGIGGLGRVEEAEVILSNAFDLPIGKRIAVKYLNDQWKVNQTICLRFEREIGIVKTLEHPMIVPYLGENVSDGPERFYAMPVYEKSLRKHMADRKLPYDWWEVAAFGARLADALAYAHARGHIHRDLKPENILMSAGVVVIADWGLGGFVHRESKVLQHLTNGGLGTEYYCSPEQWLSGDCQAPGDVYSLGMTLAELTLGRQLPMALGLGIRQDIVVANSAGAAQFNALIRRMSSMLVTGRIQSMTDVAAGLRHAAALRSRAA